MKTLLILSDSHGNLKGVSDLLPLIAENDYVVHLGDGGADMREARSLYPEKVYACGLLNLALEAKRRGCDIALYGHTHVADICEMEGVTLINPGSLRYSMGKGGSYCYLVVNKDKATPVIVGERYV